MPSSCTEVKLFDYEAVDELTYNEQLYAIALLDPALSSFSRPFVLRCPYQQAVEENND